jgi:hypothetical protein
MNSFFEFCGNMIFLGGTMALGAFIASFIVSQTLYKKEDLEKTFVDEDSASEDEDPEFEALYSLENKEIRELDDAEKEALKIKHCNVDTPAGSVLMTYAEPHFVYYAKSGSIIPYRFLDVVARKFVLDFDCLALYNKLEEEKKEEVVPAEEKKEGTEKEETKKEENSVFVVKKKKITQRKRQVKKSMNRFKYGGQIADYEKENERRELEPKEAPKKMTFSDYKKMMKNE